MRTTSTTVIVCLAAAISQAVPITPDQLVAEGSAAALADVTQPIADRQVSENETRVTMAGGHDQAAGNSSSDGEQWLARAVGVLARALHLDTTHEANTTTLWARQFGNTSVPEELVMANTTADQLDLQASGEAAAALTSDPHTGNSSSDGGEQWLSRAVGVLARALHLDTRQAANKTSLSWEATEANQLAVLPSPGAPVRRAVGEDVDSATVQLDLETRARADNESNRIMADLPRATMSVEDDMATLPVLLDS